MLGHSVLGSHFGYTALTPEYCEIKVSLLPLKLFSVSEHLGYGMGILWMPQPWQFKSRLDGALGSSSGRCALGFGGSGL